MKKVLIILLTLCLLVSLFFFIQATDLGMVLVLIEKIRYKFLILLLITFVAYLMATISWQFTLGKQFRSISTGRLFLIRHLGETVGMFNPTSIIGGDALKAFLLEDQHIPKKAALWSVFFSRMILILSQVLLFVSSLIALLIQHPHLQQSGMQLQQAALYPVLFTKWKTFQLKCRESFRDLPLQLQENKKMLLLSVLFAILHWVFGGLEFYFILKFLGLKVSMTEALVVDLGVVLFKSAGAFIPAQIGIEEYGNKFMLLAIGIPSAQIWITASILRRARQLVWIAFGILIYFILFRKSKYLNPSHDGNIVRQS